MVWEEKIKFREKNIKKKTKLSDCDKACVVSVRDALIGDMLFQDYPYMIRSIEGLIGILLESHIAFTVQYFDVSDPAIDPMVSDRSCFVFGLILSKEHCFIKPSHSDINL